MPAITSKSKRAAAERGSPSTTTRQDCHHAVETRNPAIAQIGDTLCLHCFVGGSNPSAVGFGACEKELDVFHDLPLPLEQPNCSANCANCSSFCRSDVLSQSHYVPSAASWEEAKLLHHLSTPRKARFLFIQTHRLEVSAMV